MYMDCGDNALNQLDMLTREVYLPLLCGDISHASSHGISADKLMDLLHRLMSHVETIQGHTEVIHVYIYQKKYDNDILIDHKINYG